ncbi:MAG: InlB B-repeat-containing protein [Pseudolabrys sp.]
MAAALDFFPAPAGAQTFTAINLIPGYTHMGSSAPKVSADGTVVVGSQCCNAEGGSIGFRLTYNTTTHKASAPAALLHAGLSDTSGHLTWSWASGVSDPRAGTAVIVGNGSIPQPPFQGNQTNEAVRWLNPNAMSELGFLPHAGDVGPMSSAEGVNAGVKGKVTGGTVIVGSSDSSVGGFITTQAFRWAANKMTALGILPGDIGSAAYATNADGTVVVGGSCTHALPIGPCQPFRWTKQTGIVGLGFIPGYLLAGANDVNANGSVIVGQACNVTNVQTCQAFRWTAATKMVKLGSGVAYATDAAGDIVVGSIMDGQAHEIDAFIWTVTGFQSLTTILKAHGVKLTGWTLTAATGISADGKVIVGNGTFGGQTRNWIVYLDSAKPAKRTIVVSASPASVGTVAGGGTFPAGSVRAVTATPKLGYVFVNWTEHARVVSAAARYQFALNTNRDLVAHFVSRSYAVTVAASPTTGGSVSGQGNYPAGITAAITATPKAGYSFLNWTEGGTVVSAAAKYTFTVNAAHAFVAHFAKNATITVTPAPVAGGTVAGGGTVATGTQHAVTATPKSGYMFLNWTEGGAVVSTAAHYVFMVAGNRALVAHFVRLFNIAASAAPANGGTVTGTGTYVSGSSQTVTATPANGYLFVNWTEGGTVVSSNSSYTFTLTGNRNLVANFAQAFTVTITVSPAGSGTVTGDGSYAANSTATVTATPGSAYHFVAWGEGGTARNQIVNRDATYQFTVTSNHHLYAIFGCTGICPTDTAK